MPQNRQLAYYASLLPGKESQFETPGEGYRIYKDVPIARTGWQEYLGSELKRNRGYKDEWNLEDGTLYKVYRPLAEVTHPATLASFEGKSVLDQHPSGDRVLIDALDEYEGISKGHGQNVRVGAKLPDGETPLVADLHVKHPDLNVKVDEGIREVSCGYTYLLGKDASGRLIQTQIRGNHIAIVPRGRAGSEVGIKDSALEKEGITMAGLLRRIKALGFVSWAKDAKPEDVESVIDELMPEDGEGDGMTIKELLQKSVASQGSYGLSRFSSLALAKEYANRANGIYRVVMGDDGKYWVAPARIASQLIAGGYEAADAEEFNKKGEQDMYKGAKDEQHPKGCYCADCRGEKDAAHPDGCRCDDCMAGSDKKGAKDAGSKHAAFMVVAEKFMDNGHPDWAAEWFEKAAAEAATPAEKEKASAGLKAAKKAKGAKDAEESEEGKETMAEDKGAKDSWCPTCNGAGERTAGMKCVTCNGTGHVETKPAGTKDSEEAEEKKDDESGDSDEPEVAAAMDAESEIEAEEKEEEAARDAEEKGDEEGPKDAEEKEEKEGEKDAEESESKEDEEGAMDYASIISPDEDEGEEPTFTAIDALALIGKIAPAVAKSNNQAAADALNTLRDKLTLVRDGAKDGRPDPFRALASAGVNDSAGDEPDMLSFFNGRSYQDGLKAWNDHLSQRGK